MDDVPSRPASTGSPRDISGFILFIGPILLGSLVATGIFRVACDGRASFVSVGASPFGVVAVLFAILLLLDRKSDPLLRAGMSALALFEALRLYVWMTRDRFPDFLGWLGVIGAILLTAASLRTSIRYRAAIAVVVFIAAFGWSAFAQRLSRDMLGRSSVMNDSYFCRP